MNISNLSILRERNSLIVIITQLVLSISDKMLSIGLVWYVTKTFGTDAIAWFLVFAFLPHLVFSYPTSKIINHYGVIKTIMGTEFFRGLVLLIFLAMLIWNPLIAESKSAIFAMAFWVGAGAAVFTPAILSTPPILVSDEKIVALNGLLDSSISFSTIIGAVASIFILEVLALKGLIAINIFAYFFCFVLAFLLQIKKSNNKDKDVHVDAKDQVSVLAKYPDIKKMLLSFLFFNLAIAPIFVLIPYYVEKIYRGGASDLSIIEGALGIGALVSGIGISAFGLQIPNNKLIKMIAGIGFVFGIIFALFSFSSMTVHGAFALFGIGVISTFLNVQILTYFQVEVQEDELPTIMTFVNLISTAAVPVSLIFSGLIFPYIDASKFALYLGGFLMLVSVLIPLVVRSK